MSKRVVEEIAMLPDFARPVSTADNGDGGLVTLGAVEAAYVAMIEQEYRASIVNAQQLRSARFQVVMKAHGIADGSNVTILPAEEGHPMQLRVTTPEAMPS